jgi:hypothetical protein
MNNNMQITSFTYRKSQVCAKVGRTLCSVHEAANETEAVTVSYLLNAGLAMKEVIPSFGYQQKIDLVLQMNADGKISYPLAITARIP